MQNFCFFSTRMFFHSLELFNKPLRPPYTEPQAAIRANPRLSFQSNSIDGNFKISETFPRGKVSEDVVLRTFYSCEAVSRAKLYCGALGFFQLKEFEMYWGAVFF